MAHDKPASAPAMYRPVAGGEVTQGVPVDGTNYNVILINRRQQWWWQSGPVDSCCLCFPLEAGIGTMAGLEIARNCVALMLFVIAMAAMKAARIVLVSNLAMLQEEYKNKCTGDSPTIPENDCQQLEQGIDELQNALDSKEDITAGVYVYAGCFVFIGLVAGLAGGLAGLWAVCGRSTLAAKLFLWLWQTSIAFSITASVGATQIMHSQGIPVAIVFHAVYVFFITYFTKVIWSYYAVLKARDINTSSGNGSGVELCEITDGRSGAFA